MPNQPVDIFLLFYLISSTASGARSLPVMHCPYEKKGAKPKAAPLSPINWFPFCESERDPEPQPHRTPTINALLSKAVGQSSELIVEVDIRRRINGQ